MIRVAVLAATAALCGCSGPSAPVPTGFERSCSYGPRIGGEAEMGVGNDGPITDVDARITMGGRVGGGCFGAALGGED